jgi:flagellin
LGTGVQPGFNLANIDLTTTSGANLAIQIVDAAITQVTAARGHIGAFQSDIMESNIRSLGVATENLTSADSTIRDTDIASEMTQFTKEQILAQSGVSVLAQANQMPQAVLKLLQ